MLRPQKVKNIVTLRPMAAAPLAMMKLASALSRSPLNTMIALSLPLAVAMQAPVVADSPSQPFLIQTEKPSSLLLTLHDRCSSSVARAPGRCIREEAGVR